MTYQGKVGYDFAADPEYVLTSLGANVIAKQDEPTSNMSNLARAALDGANGHGPLGEAMRKAVGK